MEKVRERITSCEKCELRASARAPVPWSGDLKKAKFLMVGEAPGGQEDEQGEPFVGAAGTLLKRAMKDVGMSQKITAFMNTVCCRPPENRAPHKSEVEACRGNRSVQIALARKVGVIILLGGTALNTWRSDMKITEDRGRPFIWKNMVMLPTYHPSYVSRFNKQTVYETFLDDLRQARARLRMGVNAGEHWPEDCRVCGVEVDRYDEQGVAYCNKHYQRGIPARELPLQGVV